MHRPTPTPRSCTTAPFLGETLVVIPALDEAASVAATVRRWLALGAARVRGVDNGSTDDTVVAARNAGAEVVAEPARGYGAAAWSGLQDWPADCRWVLFSSADGSDRLTADEMAAWQAAVDGGADLVLGDRASYPASRAQLKVLQRLGNGLTCAALRLGWGRRFADMASLRLVRREAMTAMRLTDRAFGWNVEMQVRALELGCQLVELPVGYHPRTAGESKISGSWRGALRAGPGILAMLARLLWWRLGVGRRSRADAAAQLHKEWAWRAG